VIKNTKKVSLERETRVLLEKIGSDVKTLAEGHALLMDKFEVIDNRGSELTSLAFKTEMNVEVIKSKVGTMDIKLDRIERELETVKIAVLDTGSKVSDHDHRLQKLESGH
jgi:hypothetical protein